MQQILLRSSDGSVPNICKSVSMYRHPLKSDDSARKLGDGAVSVAAFGARGDGTTDDTAAFLSALAASDSIFVPNGTFVVRETLRLSSSQTLRGSGQWLSQIVFNPLPSLPATAACIGLANVSAIGASAGIVVEGLSVAFANAAGTNVNRGIDLTAAQLATVSDVRISMFHTGLYLSRGADAAGCWFNNIDSVNFFSCKFSVDMNDESGYSVNNCNFADLHANDVGVWKDGVAYRVRGYGHHLSNIYSGGLEGDCACLEFADTNGSAVSISGNNLILGLYCESSPAFGIKVTNTTQGRGGNQVQGLHMDGPARVATVSDPWGELTVQQWGAENLSVSAYHLGQLELFSIMPSAHHAPGCAHHASFWRPEGVAAGHAAGSITSNAAGTATSYSTAADRRLLAAGEAEELDGALRRVVEGPPARRLAFAGAVEDAGDVEGFIADELAAAGASHGPQERPDSRVKIPLCLQCRGR